MSAGSEACTRVLAPCKINPTLVVIERRSDGFHELDLSYLALELCDQVEIEPAAGRMGAIRVEGDMASDDVPRDATNLARRALAGMLAMARRDGRFEAAADFDLLLSKSIPSQAGLGGGSSDAAAAALGMLQIAGIRPADPRVLSFLESLGSDTSFFFAARATGHARGRGRGERIEVLPALGRELQVVLIAPRTPARTERVFSVLAGLGDPASNRARAEDRIGAWTQASSIQDLRRALCNDLEPAALRAYPDLARWRALLDSQGCAHFQLAGSGSTFFGLCAGEQEAAAALSSIQSFAKLMGLDVRGAWLTRPAGHGVRATE
ncbi:MAG: hypothetical protein ABI054_08130 [Planctomycetota bacterium]